MNEEVRAEITNVLQMLDELAELWGDEGKFRRCRDRLRSLLDTQREDANAELRRGISLAQEYIVTLRQIVYAAEPNVVDAAWASVNARGSAWYAFLVKNDLEAP